MPSRSRLQTETQFPEEIRVTHYIDGDVSHLQVVDGVYDVEESGQPMAVYKLVEIGRVEIKHEYAPLHRRTPRQRRGR